MKAILCDVCGKEMYGRHYKVKGYFPSFYETYVKKIDVCNSCWEDFKKWVKMNKGKQDKEGAAG